MFFFEESFFLILCKEVVITLAYNLWNSTADKHFSTQGIADKFNCCNSYWVTDLPWMLSIWPNFKAAPLILHSVVTILSAFASDRKALPVRSVLLDPVM